MLSSDMNQPKMHDSDMCILGYLQTTFNTDEMLDPYTSVNIWLSSFICTLIPQ